MDIGIIIPSLKNYGGSQKFMLECVNLWHKNNDITLYTCNFDNRIIENYDFDFDINILNTPIFPRNDQFHQFFPLIMKKLKKQVKMHEIYNTHVFPSFFIDKSPMVYCPQEPLRICYDLKDFTMKREDIPLHIKFSFQFYIPFLKWMDKKNAKFDQVVANSYFSKKQLEDVYGVETSVIYPGVDYEKFKNKDCEDYILVVNRIDPAKRIEIAIYTMKYLSQMKMKIIGTGSPIVIKNLKNLVKELKLEDRIEFIENVTENELIEAYSKCFCTIFTPFREPFGMVALESMAAGKPVIGCNVGGFTEIVEDNKHGFLVEPDPKIISEKIKFLIDNPEIYKKMSKECLKQSSNFTWKKTANQLMNLFKNY